jgi:hypothetical protein
MDGWMDRWMGGLIYGCRSPVRALFLSKLLSQSSGIPKL